MKKEIENYRQTPRMVECRKYLTISVTSHCVHPSQLSPFWRQHPAKENKADHKNLQLTVWILNNVIYCLYTLAKITIYCN